MVVRLALIPVAVAAVAFGTGVSGAMDSSETFRSAIYSVQPDGHGRRLEALPDPPVWALVRSRDGRRIAFVDLDDSAVYVADVSGANRVRVISGEGGANGLIFSPDGTKLAFSSGGTPCGPRCYIRGSLYVVDVDGTDLHPIAERADQPSWSPDGTRIAYHGDLGMYVVSAAGGNARHLARNVASHVWAPRGERIAYIGNRGGYGVPCFVDADGSRRRCLRRLSAVWQLIWSQDGRRIAFAVVPGDQLAVVSADGRGLRRLGPRREVGVNRPRPLAWSPDGSRIAYTYGVPMKNIFVRSLTPGSRSKQVTSAPGQQGQLAGDVRWRPGRISYVVYQ